MIMGGKALLFDEIVDLTFDAVADNRVEVSFASRTYLVCFRFGSCHLLIPAKYVRLRLGILSDFVTG